MAEEPQYIEYEPTDESGYWRMERPDLLEADFGVTRASVERWHRFIVRTPVWEFVRRLYQTGGMTDDDPDILRPWTRAELARRFGISEKELDHDISKAAEAWKLQDARDNVARQADVESGGDLDRMLTFGNASGLSGDAVDRLLDAFQFGDVSDPMLRVQVANRLLSLREYLESQHSRSSARQLVRYEISLHAAEKLLLVYTAKIEMALADDPMLDKNAALVEGYRARAEALDKEIRATTKAHGQLQKDIGADDYDKTTQKRIAVETIGYIMSKCQEYERDPESVYLDGVFTAGEIDWQLEPLGERLPQYRPDIVLRINEAMKPENLWDPGYKPTPIQIRVAQELRKLAECMRSVPEDAPPIMEIDDESDEPIAQNGAVMVPEMDVDAAAAPPPDLRPRSGGGTPAMAVFT